MTDKEKIREVVERIFKENRERCSREGYAAVEQLRKVLAFIDSLQEEPVSNDLEEAVKKYLKSLRKSHFEGYDIERAFKKGAEWQKEKDQSTIELAEDHAYLAGQEKVIDKACEWIKYHNENGGCLFDNWENSFRKAMEK